MEWLDAMTHVDGQIAFFNDAAFGVAPDFAQLRGYAARQDLRLESRPNARASEFDAKRLCPHRPPAIPSHM